MAEGGAIERRQQRALARAQVRKRGRTLAIQFLGGTPDRKPTQVLSLRSIHLGEHPTGIGGDGRRLAHIGVYNRNPINGVRDNNTCARGPLVSRDVDPMTAHIPSRKRKTTRGDDFESVARQRNIGSLGRVYRPALDIGRAIARAFYIVAHRIGEQIGGSRRLDDAGLCRVSRLGRCDIVWNPSPVGTHVIATNPLASQHGTRRSDIVIPHPPIGHHSSRGLKVVILAVDPLPTRFYSAGSIEVIPDASHLFPTDGHSSRAGVQVVPGASHALPPLGHGTRAFQVIPRATNFLPPCLHGSGSGKIVPGSPDAHPTSLHPAGTREVVPFAPDTLPAGRVAAVRVLVPPGAFVAPPRPAGSESRGSGSQRHEHGQACDQKYATETVFHERLLHSDLPCILQSSKLPLLRKTTIVVHSFPKMFTFQIF